MKHEKKDDEDFLMTACERDRCIEMYVNIITKFDMKKKGNARASVRLGVSKYQELKV